MAAMYTANHMSVRALVVLTESGTTAKWMSRISSGISIFALSAHVATLRRVTLYRGVYPVLFNDEDVSSLATEQEILTRISRVGGVNKGDSVIMTKGDLTGVAGGTNTMKILKV